MKLCARVPVLTVFFLAVLVLCAIHFNHNQYPAQETPNQEVDQKSRVTRTILSESFNSTYIRAVINVNTSETDKRLLTYPPFQPSEEAEFPVSENTKPRIPHIIHQIFCNETVPTPYKGFIETIIKQNPTWQYRFWSHASGRKLLAERFHLNLLTIYDRLDYCDERRTNILKYAVLHEFGGVYSDFDMEDLRPLDNVTFKYACMIPVEPFENAAMRFQKRLDIFNYDILKDLYAPIHLNTDIMFCRANHPFISFCLRQLQDMTDIGDSEQFGGPVFITQVFMRYNNLTQDTIKRQLRHPTSNSPYFYKGERPEEDNDTLYIPNSQYFYDSPDPLYVNEKSGNLNRCWNYTNSYYLSKMGKHACAEFERRKNVRKTRRYAFLIHHFHNSKLYDYDRWIKAMDKIHIRKVVPGCILYE